MSDISKIQYSDGTIYNIKDANVRNTLDVSKGTYNSIGERMSAYADASEVAAEYLEYLQNPPDVEPEFRLTKSGVVCKPCMTYNKFTTWSDKTWTGLTDFRGSYIWTDGKNIYYSNNNSSYGTVGNYVLDKDTSTWTAKTWNGYTSFSGDDIWTDGENIYYSNQSNQYVLDKSTSTWTAKTWTGLTNFYGGSIWTDGDNIYYSLGSTQKVLNKSTWSSKSWSGLTSFGGSNIWTDGKYIYYSAGTSAHYGLNKSTSTWNSSRWTGTISFYGHMIWTDGENIYWSNNNSSYGTTGNYALVVNIDLVKSGWGSKTWDGLTSIYGKYIWTDGENIYYSEGTTQKVLNPLTKTTTDMPSCKP